MRWSGGEWRLWLVDFVWVLSILTVAYLAALAVDQHRNAKQPVYAPDMPGQFPVDEFNRYKRPPLTR